MLSLALRRIVLALGVLVVVAVFYPFRGVAEGHSPLRSLAPSFSAALPWRDLGPAQIGGAPSDVVGVRVPNGPGRSVTRLYVGAVGGMFVSDDEGSHWDALADAVEGSSATSAIAVSPKNPEELWRASGDPDAIFRPVPGNGVFRSLDGGAHWTLMGFAQSPYVMFIRFDPRNRDTIYVGMTGNRRFATGECGLYKSTDDGKTWQRAFFVNGWTGAVDISFDPDNSKIAYVAMQQQATDRRVMYDYGPGSGIYKTIDGGLTWRRLSFDLAPRFSLARTAVAVAPSQPSRVYAVVDIVGPHPGSRLAAAGTDPTHPVRLYRSDDSGEHWKRMADPRNDVFSYYGHVYVDPENPDRIYVLGPFLDISDDGGNTFKFSATDASLDAPVERNAGVDNRALWIDPNNTGHLVLGNDHGIYISYTAANTWKHLENLDLARVYGIGLGNDAPFTKVIAAMQDSYDFVAPIRSRGRDGLLNSDWTALDIGAENGNAVVEPSRENIILADGSGVAEDLVQAEDLSTGEMIDLGPGPFFGQRHEATEPRRGSLAISTSPGPAIYVGTIRVWRSKDHGLHWSPISPAFGRADTSPDSIMGMNSRDASIFDTYGASEPAITTIGVSPMSSSIIYAGTRNGILAVTKDSGEHWTTLRPPGPTAEITKVFPSYFSRSRVYLSRTRFYDNDFRPNLAESDDYGAHWRTLPANGLPNAVTWTITEHYKTPGFLLAGTDQGVYASNDNGSAWFRLGRGLPNVRVNDLLLEPHANDVVVGTWGRGVWVLDNITPVTEQIDQSCPHLYEVLTGYEFFKNDNAFYEDAVFAQPNPPDGTVISYYLPTDYSGGRGVDVKVRASDGTVVRWFHTPYKAGLNRFAWDLRHRAIGPSAEFGAEPPFVYPGTYSVQIEVPTTGRCLHTQRQSFEVTVAGQSAAATRTFEESYAERLKLYRLEARVTALEAAIEAFDTYVGVIRKVDDSAINADAMVVAARVANVKRLVTGFNAQEHLVPDSARMIVTQLRGELDGLFQNEGTFSSLMPREIALADQVNRALEDAEARLKSELARQRAVTLGLNGQSRVKADDALEKVQRALTSDHYVLLPEKLPNAAEDSQAP